MMNTMRKLLRAAMLLLAVLMAACTAPDTWELVSKDNNIRFVLANKKDKGEVIFAIPFIIGIRWQ